MTDEQQQVLNDQLIRDYQIVFDSDSGRRVYANLRIWSGFDDRIIPRGIPDITAFELGRRDMFLHIQDKMLAKPGEEKQMRAETEDE